jgi:drug/metabolite transporter, DME family
VPEALPYAQGDKLTGRLCILAAAVLWSTSGLFTKAPLFDDWPLEQRGVLLAFWRALFAGLSILPLVRRPSWDWRIAPLVGCFAGMSLSYMMAVTLNTAANAIWLQSTAPLWVLFYSVVLFRGRGILRRDLTTLGFCALGLGMILYFEFTRGSGAGSPDQSRLGVLCGLTAGACYGAVVMFLRGLGRLDSVWLVALAQLGTATVLAPWALSVGRWPSGVQLATLAAFGALQIALPYLLFARGLRSVASQEASLIALLEPVLVPAWVAFALGNPETQWWTLAGGALILAGLAWRYLPAAWAGARAGTVRSAKANAPNNSGT